MGRWSNHLRARRTFFERLEERALLTVTVSVPASDISHAGAYPVGTGMTQYQLLLTGDTVAGAMAGVAAPTSSAKNPAQVRTAYGVDAILFGSVIGDGTGQTIAIVDAYDDPALVSSTDANYLNSDLHRFSTQFGLADPPSFTKLSQTGETDYPTYDSGWSAEIALDVEWAHAMAPGASIVLVEANSANFSDLMAAVSTARGVAGVSVVSMSFGAVEYYGETTYDPRFSKTGVTFVGSTGDSGAPGVYPAYSPNVVAVGGTSLHFADSSGTYASESGWSGSGGGISQYENKPTFQATVTQSASKRTIPDVSMVADPGTGVWVLNTAADGMGTPNVGWFIYGGTSLSAPLFAGLVAVANQGRALLTLPALNTSTANNTLTRIYALAAADFHDVTSGSNGASGFTAGVGYDLVTGRGSPVAGLFVTDLAGGVTITGAVFNDANGNGVLDSGEAGMSGVIVYIDTNNNGVRDSGEPQMTTSSGGVYTFTDRIGHVTYVVRKSTSGGYVASSPAGVSVANGYGQTTTLNFGNYPSFTTTYTGSAYTLRLDATGMQLEIYAAADATGTPTKVLPINAVTTLSFTGTSAQDVFVVDLANGNPLANTTISYAGGSNTDRVIVRGSTGADAVTFSSTAIAAGAGSLAINAVEAFTFDGRQGYDAVAVGGAVPLTLVGDQQLDSLTMTANAVATLAAGHLTLFTRSLSIAASAALDLTDGTLVVDAAVAALATVQGYLATGANGGGWNGMGIRSSTAAGDAAQVTGLGYLTAGNLGVSTYNGFGVSASAVIVKYTYEGDATLDGAITGDDFALADRGRAKGLSGWVNGDFDYDGVVTADDLALQNQAYAVLNAPPEPVVIAEAVVPTTVATAVVTPVTTPAATVPTVTPVVTAPVVTTTTTTTASTTSVASKPPAAVVKHVVKPVVKRVVAVKGKKTVKKVKAKVKAKPALVKHPPAVFSLKMILFRI